MVKDKLSPTYIFCFDFEYPIRHFGDNHFNCVDHKKVYRRFRVAIFVHVYRTYLWVLTKSALHCFETVSQFIPGRRPSGSNISYKMAFYGHTIYGKIQLLAYAGKI